MEERYKKVSESRTEQVYIVRARVFTQQEVCLEEV